MYLLPLCSYKKKFQGTLFPVLDFPLTARFWSILLTFGEKVFFSYEKCWYWLDSFDCTFIHPFIHQQTSLECQCMQRLRWIKQLINQIIKSPKFCDCTSVFIGTDIKKEIKNYVLSLDLLFSIMFYFRRRN